MAANNIYDVKDVLTEADMVRAKQNADVLDIQVGGDAQATWAAPSGETGVSFKRAISEFYQSGGLNATRYESYQELVSDPLSVEKDIAVVITDPQKDKNGYYVNKSGTWELADYNPALQLLSKMLELDKGYNQVVHDQHGNRYDFAIANPTTRQILWGMADGLMIAPNSRLDFARSLSGQYDKKGRGVTRLLPDGTLDFSYLTIRKSPYGDISVEDSLGRSCLKIYNDGSVDVFKLNGRDEQDRKINKALLPKGWKNKDINHIVVYGQSLSEGSVANRDESLTGNEISTTQPYANIMLAGGTRSEPQMSFYQKEFAPLVEQSVGSLSENPSQNESPVAGVCNEFTRRCLARSLNATADDFVMCGMASGKGGQNIEILTNGTQWTVLEQHVKDIADLAKAEGKTEAVAAICYIQGEANHHGLLRGYPTFGSTVASDVYEYQNRFETLIDKIDDLITIECPNQDFLPYIFTYQTAAHRSYYYDYDTDGDSLNENPIATAQWFTSKSNDRVVLAIPVYALPTNDRDGVHLTHVGSWLMGAYLARAMEYTLHAKQGKWRPLEPISYDWTDDHIDIRFHIPVGHLVLDNYFCELQPNFGFDIWVDKVLQANAISSVIILNNDTLRVNLNTPTTTNAQLSYALGRQETSPNSYGNLRDTNGETDEVTDPLGNTYKLHNPSVMFNIHKSKGFI